MISPIRNKYKCGDSSGAGDGMDGCPLESLVMIVGTQFTDISVCLSCGRMHVTWGSGTPAAVTMVYEPIGKAV